MSNVKLLVAAEREFKLLKVLVAYDERQQDFDDDEDDTLSWVIPVERCYYVVAPSNHTNGELLDSITCFLDSEFEHNAEECVDKGSVAIKSVEFLTAASSADVILMRDVTSKATT